MLKIGVKLLLMAIPFLVLACGDKSSLSKIDSSQTAQKQPNIILILADDIGVETLGAYGGEYSTPNLNAMAANGVRFDNAHATPVCTPSRTRLMTGTQNFKHYKSFAHLDPDAYTLSNYMKEAGYETMIAGKWQLAGNAADKLQGMLPSEAGFDESAVWFIEHELKGGRYWGPTFVENGVRKTYCKNEFGPDILNRKILDFIDRKKDAPFFVYYPMILAHDPWVTTPSSPDAETTTEKFSGMMSYLDKLVGQVTSKLEEHQLLDNTLILFVGDNGTHTDIKSLRNGEVVQGGKWFTRDSGTHVPFIARWRGHLPEGEVRDSLIEVMDVFPTLAAVVNQPIGRDLDGKDLTPVMYGKADEVRDAIFMHYAPRWGSPHGPMVHARFAFDKKWKLYGDGRFIDLKADVGETSPLPVETLEGQELGAYQRLQKMMTSMGDGPLAAPFMNPPINKVKFTEPERCKEV